MIRYSSGGCLVECSSELPNLIGAKELFLDIETSSGDPKKDSFNPWFNCDVAGIAITVDEDQRSWYVPKAQINDQWLADVLKTPRWINHNIKYDNHVLANSLGAHYVGELHDTVISSKLVYSDFISYSLDNLAREWKLPHRKLKHLLTPYLENNRDFGRIPAEVLGEYACGDVLTNRALYRHNMLKMPEESLPVLRTEEQLTRVLFDSEQYGLGVDPRMNDRLERMKLEYTWKGKIIQLMESINQYLRDRNLWDNDEDFEPHNSSHCGRLLHESMGLPVLRWTDGGERGFPQPSFDKAALQEYRSLHADNLQEILDMIETFRKFWIINNLFIEQYLILHIDGVLHPTYNQCVRTGRMSCSQPNMQQLNSDAKALICPREGHVFLSIDYSQIEFRLIVHHIKNEMALQAYRENADTDFHSWVAEVCGVPRKPAKTINFMLGYGGGMKKTISTLAMQKELIAELSDLTDSKEAFDRLRVERAKDVYHTYHNRLPELKKTAKRAEHVCKARGYVRNLAGRRRYLPRKAAYRAFNTVNQSLAADIMKERAVAVYQQFWDVAKLLAVVHDEFLFEIRKEDCTEELVQEIVRCLESPSIEGLTVPIRCSVGNISDTNWGAC